MPYPDPMNLELTPAELDQALSDITKVIDLLNGKKQINLSKAERQGANAIDNERRPYVLKTFDKLAIDYPALRPGYIDFAIAQKDYAYTSGTELSLEKTSALKFSYGRMLDRSGWIFKRVE